MISQKLPIFYEGAKIVVDLKIHPSCLKRRDGSSEIAILPQTSKNFLAIE